MAKLTGKVLTVLTDEPQKVGDIADKAGLLHRQTGNALQRLRTDGLARKVKGLKWVRASAGKAQAAEGKKSGRTAAPPRGGDVAADAVVAAITANRKQIILFEAGRPLFLSPAQTEAVVAIAFEHFEAD